MRCLYCGKELPLFKRLRGGEFCSDAHRQQYQEEYTQLALNRLLQANANGEGEPSKSKGATAKDAKESRPAPASVKPLVEMESPALKRREKQAREEAPAAAPVARVATPANPSDPPKAPARAAASTERRPQAAVLEPEPPPPPKKSAPAPKPVPPPEEPPPARPAGYLAEVPTAILADVPGMSKKQLELESSSSPVLPRLLEFHRQENDPRLPPAGRVTPVRMARAAESSPTPRERGLEVRDFVRSTPVVEVRLAPAGEIGLSHADQSLEIKFSYRAPADSPRAWQQPDREFPLPPIALGELARLSLPSSGWSEAALAESQEEAAAPAPHALPEPAPKPVAPPAPAPVPTPPPAAQVRVDPIRFEPVQAERVVPKPVHFEPVQIDPVFMERITSPAVAEAPPAAPPQPEPAPEPPSEAPIPEPVTKPVPVTLHGLAPSRGKSVQVFASALVRPAEIQPPPQNGLPLRPLMVLGAPPELAAKTPASAPSPEKPEPRQANGKGRKPEVRVLSLQLREEPTKVAAKKEDPKPKPEQKPEPKPESKPEPKVEVSAPNAPEKVQSIKPQPVPVAAKRAVDAPAAKTESQIEKPAPRPDTTEKTTAAESPKPVESIKPLEQPKPASPEIESLGLPKLVVEADGNFWSKLPAFARLGVAAGFLALIAGGIFLTSRGSSAPRTAAPQGFPEVGPPMTDAGWATDWFTDGPASKATRHVDVLRGSLTLRDYRIEFEGQIEHQAIGWVFRANNKNFYAEKIAIAGPGFEPPVELVKIVVMNGKEQLRERIPLPFKVHLDTMYKIRTDVIGSRFVTWIQDQKVDDWTDPRIDAGGVGLYYDSGDVPKLKDSINVMTLRPR